MSVTPEYLVKLGLLTKAPDTSKDIGLLLKKALEKIAFLPFGLLIDQWRWKVFSGEIPPEKYNEAWWDLRLKYQGIAPPVRGRRRISIRARSITSRRTSRTPGTFSPIFCNSSFTARWQDGGCTGPLNRCSIYGNQAAGKQLNAMLEMGASRPWQDAL